MLTKKTMTYQFKKISVLTVTASIRAAQAQGKLDSSPEEEKWAHISDLAKKLFSVSSL